MTAVAERTSTPQRRRGRPARGRAAAERPGLDRRARVILPGAVDGDDRLQDRGAGRHDPADGVLRPHLRQLRRGVRRRRRPYLLNSLFATVASTVLVLLLGTPAAFALSLRPVKKTQDVLFFFISTKMLPVVAAIVPIYVVVNYLGALDNIWTLVVLYTAMNLPIAVWMMRSFFLEVPKELLEAASMDGASLWRSLRGSCCRSSRPAWPPRR